MVEDLKNSGRRVGRLEHRMAALSSASVQRAAATLSQVGSLAWEAARSVGTRTMETMQTLLMGGSPGQMCVLDNDGKTPDAASGYEYPYKKPSPNIPNNTDFWRGGIGSFQMQGIGKKKMAKSVKRLTIEVDSQTGRVLRQKDCALGTRFASGTQLMVRRTVEMTVQMPTVISNHRQMRRSLGLGNIRRYCRRNDILTTCKPT